MHGSSWKYDWTSFYEVITKALKRFEFNCNKAPDLMREHPSYLYKIISPENWERSASKEYIEKEADDNTFIHLSTEEQLEKILEKFWKGKPHMILKLETEKLLGDLQLERNPGGQNKYYHLYDGKIPLKAVVKKTIFSI